MTAVAEVVVDVAGIRVEASDDQDLEPVDLHRWATLLAEGLAAEGVAAPAEAGLVFVDEEAIAQLKVDHLDGDGGPTDVLAFPIDDTDVDASAGGRMVGDVVICPTYVRTVTAPVDLDAEVALLVVHGLLHLVGHDHVTPGETHAMQAREQELLERLYRRS